MYPILKILHFVGIGLLFMSIGGLCINAFQGGNKASLQGKGWLQVMLSLNLGLLLTVGTAIPMLLQLGDGAFAQGWVHAKFTLWLVIGGLGMMVLKRPHIARWAWVALPLLLGAAAALAGMKPF